MPRSRLMQPLVLLAALPAVVGLVETVRRAWVCDDVFISFRYVDQLQLGNGLVFNPGERVEGYTHFLWVMVLAAFHRLGIDLVVLGRYLPILFFVATLVVLVRRSLRQRGNAWLGLPLAAWGLALSWPTNRWQNSRSMGSRSISPRAWPARTTSTCASRARSTGPRSSGG